MFFGKFVRNRFCQIATVLSLQCKMLMYRFQEKDDTLVSFTRDAQSEILRAGFFLSMVLLSSKLFGIQYQKEPKE